MSTSKKKQWKVVEMQWWWPKNYKKRRPCTYLSYGMQKELDIERLYARNMTACRAKRLAKQLDAYYRRVLPAQQEQYRLRFEAVPMGTP